MGIAQCTSTATPLSCPAVVACITAQPTGTPAVAGDLVLGKDGQFHALPDAAIFATPAQTIAGTATNLIVNPADLFARENIPAQAGLGLVLSAIPAPAANQSPWGTNTLGETLHYMPGVGWQIVSGFYRIETAHPDIPVGAGNTVNVIAGSHTALRAGKITVSFFGFMGSTTPNANTYFSVGIGKAGQATIAGNSSFMRDSNSQSISHSATATFTVAAGDVITYRISAVNGVDVAYMKSTVLYSA